MRLTYLFIGTLTLAPGLHAQGGDGPFTVSEQQMLQGVDAGTEQRLAAASSTIQKSPSDVNALVTRAMISLTIATHNMYRYQWVHFAALDLERVLRIDPRNFYALHNYAEAWYMAGDVSDAQPNMRHAVTVFTQALQINPRSARTYMGRGWAYLMLDDEADADADFNRTLQIDPSLRNELTNEAQAIRQKRGQKAGVKTVLRQMGHYVVISNARNPEQCAAVKGWWSGTECRQLAP